MIECDCVDKTLFTEPGGGWIWPAHRSLPNPESHEYVKHCPKLLHTLKFNSSAVFPQYISLV